MTLTASGFLAKRLPQIKAELESEFQTQFGSDLNLSPETLFGQLIGVQSDAWADTWAMLDDVYQSQYPSTASGASLDLLVALNGLARLPALPTTVAGYMTLTVGTTITTGNRAKDVSQTYSLTEDVTADLSTTHGVTVSVPTATAATVYSVTIDGVTYSVTSDSDPTVSEILTALSGAISTNHDVTLSGTTLTVTYEGPLVVSVSPTVSVNSVVAVGQFQADATGPIALPIGAMNQIETPVAGWLSVTNRAAGTLGRDIETDTDLRVRRDESVRLQAVATIDGITAQLRQTENVLDAIVLQNDTDATNADGVPAHSIWCIVEGGAELDIGAVIFRRKAAGIGTFGNVSTLAFSAENGTPYEIRFGRPTSTPVYITVNINASASIPSDYVARVRDALVAHGDEFLGIGDDLILNRLFTPASRALDDLSFVSSITLDVTPSPVATANLTADTDERFQIVAGNIDVLLD